MSDRPFDDGRWPEDGTGHAECFLCGKPVDPLDPKRGTYEIAPAGGALPIHLPCLNPYSFGGTLSVKVEVLYRAALNEMSDQQLRRAGLR